ncbi:hypothetical protein [Chelativorans sp. ZYF759]|uniref:hypothetical protein n=1 Tax=Chelativorans sp. ZYF759 TaxID=2692213 RepID=UPI001FEE240A|nr:hypothetical protein [Chelativorans sp. ZYF759]
MGDWDIGEDWMSRMGNIGEKTLGPVAIHGGLQLKHRQQNRDAFKSSKESELITQAHASAVSALVNFLSRMAGKPIPADREDAQGQAALIAHFVQGIDLCETAIVEGLYPQAATLLRQQHEIIAAVEEFTADRRKDGKTPHATIGVLRDMGRIYGDLSGGAHVSHANLLKNFVIIEIGENNGPSLLPIYHHEITLNLYALHVSYILMMLELAGDVQNSVTGDTLNSDEVKLHFIGRQILIDLGLIRFEEASVPPPQQREDGTR